ncbi:TetR/AcrR family transcriptional regulator [Sphingorhabdus sp.]|uniref:TetR/AcrR family transcriptional regulator n=1 Tax=Sphingorhabdus sp. TaxID=1902408 RepID=UPI0038FC429D
MTKGGDIGQRRSTAKEISSSSYQLRRMEISEASIRVFNRLGFQGASYNALAAELKSNHAALYYYISSKEELFDELVRSVVERNLEIVKQIQKSRISQRRKLRNLITTLMTSYGEHYPLFCVYIRGNLSDVSDKRSE